MSDKTKKTILFIIVGILLILIGGVSVALFLYINGEDDTIEYEYIGGNSTTKVVTTTTVEDDEEETTTTSGIAETSTTSSVTTNSNNNNNNNNNSNSGNNQSNKTTTKTTKTTKTNYYSSTSWSSSTSTSWDMPTMTVVTTTRTSRNTVNSNSTYPNALNDWEWAIVNKINAFRKSQGFKELGVVEEFRSRAEQAADEWNGKESGLSDLENKLKDMNFYVYISSGKKVTEDTFYNKIIEAVNLNSSSKYSYIGVGLIQNGSTYKMIVIFE